MSGRGTGGKKKIPENSPTADQLRVLIDRAPDAMSVQADGVYLYVNRSWLDLFGARSASEMIGTRVSERVPADRHEALRARILEIQENRSGMVQYEEPLLKMDGTRLEAEISVTWVEWGDSVGTLAIVRDISQRNKALAEVSAAHSLLQTIIDYLPFSIYVKDRQGKYLLVNRGFAELHQSSVEAMKGKDSGILLGIRSETIEELLEKDREVFATGQPVELPRIVVNTPDGRTIIRRGMKSPILDGEGRVEALVGITEDITERVRNEEALRESERRFRNLVEGSIQGVAILNSQREIVFANQALADIFGYPDPESMLPLDLSSALVAPEDQERLREYQKARLAGDSVPEIYEFRGIRAGGTKIWLENFCKVVEWQGEPAVQVTLQDITKRKQAEEEAQAAQRLLRTVFDTIPHRVFVKDRESRYLMVNQAFADFIGKAPDEILGKTLPALVPGLEGVFIEDDRRVMNSGEKHDQFEAVKNPRSGKMEQTRTIKLPLRDEDGQIIGLVGLAEDITGHRNIEEQLRQSQKMEAVGQLAGGVAHDFNNLLTIVIGNLELARRNIDAGENSTDNLERAMEAANRGANLTHRLLAFSRRQTLQPDNIDLNELIEELMGWLSSTLGETIEIELSLAAGLWKSRIDPHQMELAIMNLALNARDAMKGEGQVKLITANRSISQGDPLSAGEGPAGDYVMISVEDTGTGVDAKIRDRVFEPFFTTKEVGQGSGLGLSMVYGFVHQSGGHIYFDSPQGRGAIVTLLLPRANSEPARENEPAAPQESDDAKPAAFEGKGETILVVEDDGNVRRLAVAVLSTLGFQTVEAQTGMEAMALLDSHPSIRLMFSDVVLPGGKNGIDIAKEAMGKHPGLKVLLTSGYTEYMANHASWRQPGLRFIQKPYRIEDLSAMLGNILAEEEKSAR